MSGLKIFFAAGDVGGARAILPVAKLASKSGYEVYAYEYGVFYDEGETDWHWLDFSGSMRVASKCDAVIYATSVNDLAAVKIACHANASSVPTVHVLDNWSSYRKRIETYIPSYYTVMDDVAFSQASLDGVPEVILRITGHPGLGELGFEQRSSSYKANEKKILFVSEPVSTDQGIENRGYDEITVANLFSQAILSQSILIDRLLIAPHPRECRQAVCRRMRHLFGMQSQQMNWVMVPEGSIRQALSQSTHVVGMTSLLLYEAWLLGKPTLSLQPGLKNVGLRELSTREGLVFHDETGNIYDSVSSWIEMSPGKAKHDLELHRQSAGEVLNLVRDTFVGGH